MKLSKTQLKVLQVLAEDGNYALFMGYAGWFNQNAYWFDHNHMSHIRVSTMDVLEKQGYITITKDDYMSKGKATITDKGCEVLI